MCECYDVMNRTLRHPPSGDDLLSRDENTSRKHWECSNDDIIRGTGDTDSSPNIGTVVIYTTKGDVCVCVFAKLDQFLPVRSHFDTKRPVNFFHIATFQSATFGRPLFAFVLCVLRQKIIKNRKCSESVSIGVIVEVRSAKR